MFKASASLYGETSMFCCMSHGKLFECISRTVPYRKRPNCFAKLSLLPATAETDSSMLGFTKCVQLTDSLDVLLYGCIALAMAQR